MSNEHDEESSDEMEVIEANDSDNDIDDGNNEVKAYIPGGDTASHSVEELVRDETAYHMYHQAQTGDPCLSFDVIIDQLGNERTTYPHTAYLAAGTQAEKSHLNSIIVMKMSNLFKNSKEAASDSESEDEDDETPELNTHMISVTGSVNRLRVSKIADKDIAACWCETGRVHIFDISSSLQNLEVKTQKSTSKPLHTFAGHQTEGYAVDWSSLVPGRLATGDCKKNIHVWKLQDGGSWHVDQRPFTGHTDSVEDIQWSPNESNVFSSCSVDHSIRIWDIRAVPNQACMLTKEAHSSDVNVISWNRKEPFIVSGGDDGVINVWDLRQFKSTSPVAKFKHHTGPITSVEWHATDSTVFAASGADDQLTLWDLAVERNQEETSAAAASSEIAAIPPQLLFIHQGQKDIKELHWHPQIPGVIVSTALSGFNIFKTISV